MLLTHWSMRAVGELCARRSMCVVGEYAAGVHVLYMKLACGRLVT